MTESESQKKISTEGYHATSMKEFVVISNDETNAQLLSLFFIGEKEESISNAEDNGEDEDNISAEHVHVPEKNEINKYYLSNFTLKNRKEAVNLVKEKHARFAERNRAADFFVYDERARKLIPFKKNDYLMYDNGHFTFDGKNYIYYDNNGIEKRRSSYDNDNDING